MKNKPINYGFVRPQLASDHYVLGASASLSKDILQADGQWDDYLPDEERQSNDRFDTYSCTSFGTLNCIEILKRKIHGETDNFSDRFLGICAGTRPPGNDPHVVAEALRKNGVISEERLPFSSTLETVEDYYSFLGANEGKCRSEGKQSISKEEFGHEWVFTNNPSKEARTALMKQALTYSPIGASFSAWFEQDGVYVDFGQPNNHWGGIYGWNDRGWKGIDTYPPFKKIISFDHNIEFAKRYSLTPAIPQKGFSLCSIFADLFEKRT